jgi:DNA/RNA endonuclease G (NUC1)
MRTRRSAVLVLLASLAASCVGGSPFAPDISRRADIAPAPPSVRISEIHYDNAGTDVGEAIEISGPAGTSLAGYSLVLYNGNVPAASPSYSTTNLSGTIPATCGARGVVVTNYAVNGIQNGDPDGVALVNNGTVIEFLSYGVTTTPMTASNGPAAGLVATDIGVKESSTTPIGQSLHRNGAGTWFAPSASSFGTCNDNDAAPPAPVVTSVVVSPTNPSVAAGATQAFTATAYDATHTAVPGVVFTWSSGNAAAATVNVNTGVASGVALGTATITATAPNSVSGNTLLTVTAAAPPPVLPATRFSEIHYDNAGTDVGEAIEVEGPAGTNLAGWSVVLYDGNGGPMYGTTALTGTIPANCKSGTRGVIVVNYPANGLQSGSPDGFALVNASNQVVEFLSYEGVMTATDGPAANMQSIDILVSENNSPVGQSLARKSDGAWEGPIASSFGTCNADATTAPPTGGSISFSGRSAITDPALPVGFQAQIFATVKDANNNTITPGITWSSDTPDIASIDQRGVITALKAGTAIFRATTPDAVTATYSLPMIVATSGNASYIGNAAFGEPTDSDPSDDYIVRRPEFTSSFSYRRNTPNWVAYEIDPTDFGGQDRCNCFTYDPELPASFTRYTTADYTGAGAIAGYGIDRGHLARSFDRTAGSLDNAHAFLFSNIVPQSADLNQGPWAVMENDLGDMVRTGGKEVYVITGVAGHIGTIKNEGLITIPAYMWKVAVIMQHDKGLADVVNGTELQVIAAVMPNIPGVKSVDWNTYRVSVDSVEALSGYDLLALLPDNIEAQLESGNHFPVASAGGAYTGAEGSSVALNGSASIDPDQGDVLSYSWNFGDGTSGTGVSPSHVFANNGTYTVTLIVTDQKGAATTATTTATIMNVAPTVTISSAASWQVGVASAVSVTYTDPNPKDAPFVVRMNWGDHSSLTQFITTLLPTTPYLRTHTYAAPGSYTVTVAVTDRDGAVGTQVLTVVVQP